MRKLVAMLTPFIVVTLLLVAAAALVSDTPAASAPLRVPLSAAQGVQMDEVGIAVRVYRGKTWTCQAGLRENPYRAEVKYWDLPRSIQYRHWVRDLWKARNTGCGERYARKVLPNTNDWVTATAIAQRVYPGTQSWLLSCSGAEGGHGPWVWYGGRLWAGHHIGNDFLGMDTVGGWLQFRYSTFEPYSEWAFADVERKGFIIPNLGSGEYDAWLSPIGQALTGAYMRFYGRDGHHWSASSGNGC